MFHLMSFGFGTTDDDEAPRLVLNNGHLSVVDSDGTTTPFQPVLIQARQPDEPGMERLSLTAEEFLRACEELNI